MSWIYIAFAAIIAVIIIGVIVKMYLKQRLNDIDGLGRTSKAKENVIASFGDDTAKASRKTSRSKTK